MYIAHEKSLTISSRIYGDSYCLSQYSKYVY